jgi:Flp pilus assembly protein TadB
VQRAASLTLATPTDSVSKVADQVIAVTDRFGGIVQSSQVSSGDSSTSQATFDLAIPSARLDAALAELSRLAHVRSRQQSSLDITDPYDAVRSRLAQARAQRQSLLGQLARARATGQSHLIRLRLRQLTRRIQSDQRQLGHLDRLSRFADVGVAVEGSGAHGAAGGSWNLDDGLHAALRVLAVTLVVLLVALAALLPSALVAALLLWAARSGRRRRREQSLEGI